MPTIDARDADRRAAAFLSGITYLRVLLTPVVMWFVLRGPEDDWAFPAAAVLFAIAAITDFIDSLSASSGPGYTNLVVAKNVQDPIDLKQGAASFESAPVARFPIIGQIMEPGRAFHPPATSVMVQAIYDADSVAVLLRWHDMSPEKTGKNGPSLPVPAEEEEEASVAAAGGDAPVDFGRPGVAGLDEGLAAFRPGEGFLAADERHAADALDAAVTDGAVLVQDRPDLGGEVYLFPGAGGGPGQDEERRQGGRIADHGKLLPSSASGAFG